MIGALIFLIVAGFVCTAAHALVTEIIEAGYGWPPAGAGLLLLLAAAPEFTAVAAAYGALVIICALYTHRKSKRDDALAAVSRPDRDASSGEEMLALFPSPPRRPRRVKTAWEMREARRVETPAERAKIAASHPYIVGSEP